MKTHKNNGQFSAYGLACGYVQVKYLGKNKVELWKEGGVYHVQKTTINSSKKERKSFDVLKEAYVYYNNLN